MVLVLILVLVLVVTLPLSALMVLVIFGFRKKNERGSDDWSMLLPLNPQGFLREAPGKFTTVNKNCCYCCYR